jgi:hypothetical protein
MEFFENISYTIKMIMLQILVKLREKKMSSLATLAKKTLFK